MRLRIRIFHLYHLLRRPLTVGVRAVVIDAHGAILLVRHTYVGGWHLPGGGVEPGETLEDCLVRELREEGNIVLLGSPVLKSVHLNRSASRRDHVAVYLVADFRQEGKRKPDLEIAEARFFPLDDLPDGTTSGTRRRLAEIFNGQPVSAEW
ncbi:NUDIX domain-containing protein [Chelativorans sp. Marseille-P2723]|uniref:NUDIX domain-containing protein n=1 Tax=Chelativorans sp. Marseille-P2723 TaxID=2709133 RepID=UPI001FED5E1F|nr:NUDIX domain-containing protein [Chelativorans sp. Marseille-P2723]